MFHRNSLAQVPALNWRWRYIISAKSQNKTTREYYTWHSVQTSLVSTFQYAAVKITYANFSSRARFPSILLFLRRLSHKIILTQTLKASWIFFTVEMSIVNIGKTSVFQWLPQSENLCSSHPHHSVPRQPSRRAGHAAEFDHLPQSRPKTEERKYVLVHWFVHEGFNLILKKKQMIDWVNGCRLVAITC